MLQVLEVMNRAAVNIYAWDFVWVCFQLFWVNTKERDCWIISMVRVRFCKKLPNCLPKSPYHFASPPATSGGSYCLASLPAFGAVRVFLDLGHSHGCVMAFLGCFNLHSLNIR